MARVLGRARHTSLAVGVSLSQGREAIQATEWSKESGLDPSADSGNVQQEQQAKKLLRSASNLSAAARMAGRMNSRRGSLDKANASQRVITAVHDLGNIAEEGANNKDAAEGEGEDDQDEEDDEEEDVPLTGFAARLAGKGEKKMIKRGEMDDLAHLGAAGPVQVIGGDGPMVPMDPALANPAPRPRRSEDDAGEDGRSDAGKSHMSFASRAMSRAGKGRDAGSDSDVGIGAVGADTFANLDVEAEGDGDVLHVLEAEGAAERSRKAKRLQTMLTSSEMQRPIRALRFGLWIVVAGILAAHSLSFALFIWRFVLHDGVLENLAHAGESMELVARAMVLSRKLQAIGAGFPVADSADDIRTELGEVADALEHRHEGMYEATQGEMSPWKGRLVGLWQERVVQLSVMDAFRNGDKVRDDSTLTDLWDAGNDFLAHVASVRETSGDAFGYMAELQSFNFVIDNGLAALSPRYHDLMRLYVERAESNLSDIGTFAIVFLVIEAVVVVPIAILYLHVLMKGVLSMRLSLLSVLMAVPRPVMSEVNQGYRPRDHFPVLLCRSVSPSLSLSVSPHHPASPRACSSRGGRSTWTRWRRRRKRRRTTWAT